MLELFQLIADLAERFVRLDLLPVIPGDRAVGVGSRKDHA